MSLRKKEKSAVNTSWPVNHLQSPRPGAGDRTPQAEARPWTSVTSTHTVLSTAQEEVVTR